MKKPCEHKYEHTKTKAQNTKNRLTDTHVSFETRSLGQLDKKHPHLRDEITRTLITQMNNDLFKCKFATNLRWHGLPIYECRVNEKSLGAVRVAFAVNSKNAVVLFASKTTQKRAFTAELEAFLRKAQA